MIAAVLLAVPTLICIYFICTYILHLVDLRNYPKGPFPLPVIGNLHLLSEKPFQDLINLAKVYGDVFSISFGMERVVVVNTIEGCREALLKKGSDFSGRSTTSLPLQIVTRGFQDIAFSDYTKQWSFLRKLTHQSMHLYGNEMKQIEENIIEETENICSTLESEGGKPIPIHKFLGISLTNVISKMVFGKRFDIDDSEFKTIMQFTDLIFTGLNPADTIVFLPWLRFFPSSQYFKNTKKGVLLRDKYLRQELSQHRESFKPGHIRDLTDSLLEISQKKELWEKSGFENVTDDQLEMILNDMFLASIDTTLTTLRWFFLFMLHFPEYQRKIHLELVSVIGIKRKVAFEDINALPLVKATIQETHRLASIGPLAIPHKATVNSSISGMKIQKGTQVFFNFYNMHHDERYWENPFDFKPERWLTPDGSLRAEKDVSFIPFGAGQRNCLGEKMARSEMFMMIARTMMVFEILPDPNSSLPNLEGVFGLSYHPKKFNAVFQKRI